ncbi:MAG TPA: hypothetical protein PKE20_04410 [Promineifilum sp.]|nr:hypothetical protein [Promineifilum sp.]
MKRFTLLLLLAALLMGCDNATEQPSPTSLPPAPTAPADGGQPTAGQSPTATGYVARLAADGAADGRADAHTLADGRTAAVAYR